MNGGDRDSDDRDSDDGDSDDGGGGGGDDGGSGKQVQTYLTVPLISPRPLSWLPHL